jgi:hypothetical protein
MFPAETFRNTLGTLAAILTGRGIRFHLTGGVTSIAYGEPRMTPAVDMVVDPVPLEAGLAGFLAAVEAAGFLVEPESVRRAVRDRGMFQLFDLAESLKVDLYPRELIPGELDRSVMVDVFVDLALPIASRTDAALSKLVWASKGSHKSRRDLRQLLARADDDERAIVERSAATLGLGQLLGEVLAEPDEIEP